MKGAHYNNEGTDGQPYPGNDNVGQENICLAAAPVGARGFEIHIGDEGDTRFWAGFFAKVGDVDVILSVTERLQWRLTSTSLKKYF